MTTEPDPPLVANSLVVGVTGHRKLHPAGIPALQARIAAFLQELGARCPDLPLVVMSSLAEGSDQLVAQVALDLGIRVIAPLPLPVELYRDDFEGDEALPRLQLQLQQVEVLQMQRLPGLDHGAVAIPGGGRDRQYAQAGMFVSSHCQVLLALWDGEQSDGLGGTSQVVHFHLHGRMPGAAGADQDSVNLLGADRENLVYHLKATRVGEPEPVDSPGRWLSVADDRVHADLAWPPLLAQVCARQAAFTRDVRKYAVRITSEGDSPAAASCPVWRSFVAADWLARTYQRRVARVLKATYVLVALMGFTFFTYTHVVSHDMVIYAFLVLFLVGLGVMTLAGRRQWQRKYLDYRTLAEGLRVQSYWRRAGIAEPGVAARAHDNFVQRQDVELGWIRNVMRGASIDGMLVPVEPDAVALHAVVEEWIGGRGRDGQLGYYAAATARRSRLHHRAEALGLVCIGLGVAVSVVLVLFAGQFDAHTKHILVSVMGILSVAAAVHEAYMHKKADKELIRQYGFMQRIFGSARRLLEASDDPGQARRVLVALGEAALAEHAGWSLMHRERPLPHSRI